MIADLRPTYVEKSTGGIASCSPELELPPDFPRDVEVVATDLDRTLIWEDDGPPAADARGARAAARGGLHVIVVTGRMVQSVRPRARAGALDDPLVCYQGARRRRPDAGELLHEPIPLDARARGDRRASTREGYGLNVYVDDELYVAEVTPEAERYADFQHIELHPVGAAARLARRRPTKLVGVGDPDALDGLGAGC